MRRHNAVFAFKLHPSELDASSLGTFTRSQFTNLHFVPLDSPLEDMADWMTHADLLVTDYSSAIFDFLLAGRPIAFAPFDLERYLENRGMGMPYEEATPGPIARDWNVLLADLDRLLSGLDPWREARDSGRRRFNAHLDSKSCKRVVEAIRTRYAS